MTAAPDPTPRAHAFDRLDEAAFVRARLARLPRGHVARNAYHRIAVAALVAARVSDGRARKTGWRLP
jgi:hypothetical protein